MKRKLFGISATCILLLIGCSFNKPVSESLADVSSIYSAKRDPAFSSLDKAIRNDLSKDYFGFASDDTIFKMDVRGVDVLSFAKRSLEIKPKEVAFRSTGLEGEASGVESSLTISEAQGSYTGGIFDKKLLDEPVSFGMYTKENAFYYDFSDLEKIDALSDYLDSSALKGKVSGEYGGQVTSFVSMLPLFLESQATFFSKKLEEGHKENPDKIALTKLGDDYHLSFSVDGLDELEGTLLLLGDLLLSSPIEIPLGNEEDSETITITKENFKQYVETIFSDVELKKYDCEFIYNEGGMKEFSIDIVAAFLNDSFKVNIANSDASFAIQNLALNSSFHLLDDVSCVVTFPDQLEKL